VEHHGIVSLSNAIYPKIYLNLSPLQSGFKIPR